MKVAVPYPAAAIGVVRAELSAGAARQLVLGSELTGAAECQALGVFDTSMMKALSCWGCGLRKIR